MRRRRGWHWAHLRAARYGGQALALTLIACGFAGASWFVAAAHAQSAAPPTLTGPVNDFANAIEPGEERDLERRIRSLQQASGDVVVVATVSSIEP